MKMFKIFFIVMSITSSLYASRNAEELYFACSSSDAQKLLACVAYLHGASDMYQVFNGDGKMRISCSDEADISLKQLRLLFLKYMRENPERGESSATIAFFSMMSYYYPCNEVK